MELRTARANGVPHSTIRFGRNPRKWSPIDRTLAVALTVYEDGLCPKCGHPRDRSWNEDMDGWYTAHKASCVACRAVRVATADVPLRSDEVVYVTDDSPDGLVPKPEMAHKG